MPNDRDQGRRQGAPFLGIGCAGWAIPPQHAQDFPAHGTHLERYAQRLPVVEINSSFYRPHRPSTYARWAAAVPPTFRFAVKVPREITHVQRLGAVTGPLERFLEAVQALGPTLGPLLVQLPPSLRFQADTAVAFFTTLRGRFPGATVCEPRHRSWFRPEAEHLLERLQVARVAADPTVVPAAAGPGGWRGLAYYRLHGTPQMYYSSYADAYLEALAVQLTALAATTPTWCIFDNTARGAATTNARELLVRLGTTPCQG
jgi:uncharacterized protein YecE (DUF72 family)